MPAFVTFWGTRGAIPTPASWTRVYGGNTSCVEIRFDDVVFICDAGLGIRELGKDLARRNPPPQNPAPADHPHPLGPHPGLSLL